MGGFTMNITKNLGVLVASLLMMLAFAASAQATVTIEQVKLDGDVLSASGSNSVRAVDRGEELEVRVQLTSNSDMDDAQVEVAIRGYDHDDLVEDITDTFDMKQNVTYVKKLSLPLRDRLDQDQYKLRVRVSDRDNPTVEQTYELDIEAERHSVMIRDVILNPENEVKAGRALLASVRIGNFGQKDEKDMKVTVAIPELGVSATSYLDEIEKEDDDDDSKTSEEMFLRIPEDAKTGTYTLVATVSYDEGDERESKEVQVKVVGDESASSEEKTIITLASDLQTASAGGAEVSFPITLTNAGSTSKVYTIMVEGANWATFKVSPTNVMVVESGESKAAVVSVAPAKNAPSGVQTFLVTVMADGKVLKQVPMKVNVSGDSGYSLKKALEVGLIVLLILIVIIGLILGFSRKRDDEEKDNDKSYY
jgi:uncharacterized membrane protein